MSPPTSLPPWTTYSTRPSNAMTLRSFSVGLLCSSLILGTAFLSVRTGQSIVQRLQRKATVPWLIIDSTPWDGGGGYRIGAASAALTVIMFWDYECSTCMSLERRTQALRKKYPTEMAVVYRPFPLPFHAHGVTAAIAVECAGAVGKAAALHDALSVVGDSLMVSSWPLLALTVTITDTTAFKKCMFSPETAGRIADYRRIGARLGISETPTFIIGKELYRGMPWDYERIIEDHISKAVPVAWTAFPHSQKL